MSTEPRNDWPGRAEMWWRDWSPDAGDRRSGRERAAFARLRRARDAIDALAEPATLDLLRRLPGADPDRVATLAAVLAHVRETESARLARAVGCKSFGDEKPPLSEGRFRRLMQSEHDELGDALRRLVRLTKGRANVRDLAATALCWGDRVRKRWIFDYYAVSVAAPRDASAATDAGTDLSA